MLKLAATFDETLYPVSVEIDARTRGPELTKILAAKVDSDIKEYLETAGIDDYRAFSTNGILTYHFKSKEDLAVAEKRIYVENGSHTKVQITPQRSVAQLTHS